MSTDVGITPKDVSGVDISRVSLMSKSAIVQFVVYQMYRDAVSPKFV